MKQRQRMEWLLAWMQKYGSADVLNRDLVDEYLSVTGANFKIVFFGAPKCPQLGRDLSRMARLGYAKRRTTGKGWGLLIVEGTRVEIASSYPRRYEIPYCSSGPRPKGYRRRTAVGWRPLPFEGNKHCETAMLVSALARINEPGP